ncbi:MAG: S8/S53 family peptidase [Actinobacteria bacterium]|nr:S8/S53 family peptidase [Actinomycetota bacterium]
MSRYPSSPRALGRPFGQDYDRPDLSGPEADRAARGVRRQVRELGPDRHGADEERVSLALERIGARWRGRSRMLGVQPTRRGAQTYTVGGELLVAAASWPHLEGWAADHGLDREPVGCADLEDRLVRLVARDPQTDLTALAAELRSDGHAASLSYITPSAPIIKPWGGIGAPALVPFGEYHPGSSEYGRGVRVAVVDTGIAAATRPDGWLDAVEREAGERSNIDPLDALPADGYLDLSAGHGTFVAGLVQQVAPGADITVYRAIGTAGTGSEVEVACQLIRAVRDGAQVVNLSLGTPSVFDEPPLALATAFDVIREIELERGWETVVVAAAGNLGDDSPVWPAAFGRVVAVGSLTAQLRPAAWSSRGHWVDFSTVGEGVVSTFVTGTQSPDLVPDPETFGDTPWARWTGTSFSAPQVTGAIARAMTEHDLSAPDAVKELLATGRPVPGLGRALHVLPGV